MGPIQCYLEDDHRRLEALLAQTVADPDHFDHEAYRRFRGGLLRHIGIEEKILLAEARKRLGGEPHPSAHGLRIEHGAIASLLVPTPDHALMAELAGLLNGHNLLEEGPDLAYAQCEALLGDDAPALLRKILDFPEPKMNRHYDGPGTYRSAAAALEASAKQKFR